MGRDVVAPNSSGRAGTTSHPSCAEVLGSNSNQNPNSRQGFLPFGCLVHLLGFSRLFCLGFGAFFWTMEGFGASQTHPWVPQDFWDFWDLGPIFPTTPQDLETPPEPPTVIPCLPHCWQLQGNTNPINPIPNNSGMVPAGNAVDGREETQTHRDSPQKRWDGGEELRELHPKAAAPISSPSLAPRAGFGIHPHL